MNYEWKCPDCKKTTDGSTTGTFEEGMHIVCCWCGRISNIKEVKHIFYVNMTNRKESPTELEKLEMLKAK